MCVCVCVCVYIYIYKEYYGKLWNERGSKGEEGTEEERRSEGTEDNENLITIEELNEVLKHAKKQEKLQIR